jgi:menaquinol-cytochrome c reductase iron-sulfur subunit
LADPGDKKQGDGDLARPEPPGWFEGESMTRRRAFTVVGQALGGAAAAAVVLPAAGFALAPLFEQEEEIWQSVGAVDEFTPDTYTAKVITIVPGIGEAGKSTAYIRQGSTDLQEDPADYVAVSTRCAHAGCPVRFVQAAGNFICPCHGGVYGFRGEVIGGPPVRPLDRFQTRVSNGQVEVGPRFSVTNALEEGKVEPVRARDPGEFTGGIWEYLYPPRPSVPPPP